MASRDVFLKSLSEARLFLRLSAYAGTFLELSLYALPGVFTIRVYSGWGCCGKLVCLFIACGGGFLSFWNWVWISFCSSCGRDWPFCPLLAILFELPNAWGLILIGFWSTWFPNAWLLLLEATDCWIWIKHYTIKYNAQAQLFKYTYITI